MRVRCPQCHSPIELPSDGELSDISCPSCGSSFSLLGTAETMPFEPGTRTIGHFELVEKVGVGTFGFVWKARDTELDRTVALKVPRKGQLGPGETEQFLREARAAAQLRHANIVSVHEVGRDQDTVFIVSDFVEGATLADRLAAQRLSIRECAQLCVTIADALHHAHETGVVHRDLKPGNVMLDAAGQPHIMDFGLARREVGEVTMTVEGRVLGTPAYMSPEQARGPAHTADRRSDVYSLGVILFEMLTGERPFRGSVRMLVTQVLNDEPPSPRRLNGSVPRDLETICLKCLEKDPGKRYDSAGALAEDLRGFLEGEPIHARPITRSDRVSRWCKRNPVVSVLAFLLLLVLLGGFFGISCQWIRANREAARAKGEADRYRRLLYVAEMNVAGQSWNENNFSRVEEILGQWEPKPGTDDLRGFEWYYLRRLCERGRGATTIDQTGRARKLAVSSKQDRIAVGYGDGTVRAWGLGGEQELGLFREASGFWPLPSASLPFTAVLLGWERPYVAFSPDGNSLACPSQDYRDIIVYSISTGTEQRRVSAPDGEIFGAVAFSPDGRYLATRSTNGVVSLWRDGSDIPRELHGHTREVLSITFSAQGEYVASGGNDGSIFVWEVVSGNKINTLTGHVAGVWSVCFAADPRFLASGSMDTTVRLWDRSSESATILAGHTDEVRSVTFSQDGELLASGGADGIPRLWRRWRDSKCTGRGEPFLGHSDVISAVMFPPDRRTLITASHDCTLRVWDLRERRVRLSLNTHRSIDSADLATHGLCVASWSRDGTIRIWRAADEKGSKQR